MRALYLGGCFFLLVSLLNLRVSIQSKIMKITVITILTLLSISCSRECITCTNGVETFERCDEEDGIYTDVNGQKIEFEDIAESWEQVGYNCN